MIKPQTSWQRIQSDNSYEKGRYSVLSPKVSKEKDGSEDDQQLFDLSKLQASADNKQTDFETRKRARLVSDGFQSDKGERIRDGIWATTRLKMAHLT